MGRGFISDFMVVGDVRSNESVVSKSGKPYRKLTLVVRRWRRTNDGVNEEYETVLQALAFGKNSEAVEKHVTAGDLLGLRCRVESRPSADGTFHNLTLFIEEVILLPGNRLNSETEAKLPGKQPAQRTRQEAVNRPLCSKPTTVNAYSNPDTSF
jgi:single-stranded DNA-binding protein